MRVLGERRSPKTIPNKHNNPTVAVHVAIDAETTSSSSSSNNSLTLNNAFITPHGGNRHTLYEMTLIHLHQSCRKILAAEIN